MPPTPASADWVYFVLGGLLGLASLALLAWAMFHDARAHRSKFRCPKCWYDLSSGADGVAPTLPVTCSECGRVTSRVRHLRRSRRRYRWAFVGFLLLCGSGTLAYYPLAHRHGWLMIVPSRLLIDSVPIFGYPTVLTDELWRRSGCTQYPRWAARSYELSMAPADHAYLVRRVVEGTWWAPPRSRRWARTLGVLQQDFQMHLFNLGSDGSCLTPSVPTPGPAVCAEILRLLKLPAQVTLRTRPVWPIGVPIFIECRAESWWPYEYWPRFTVMDEAGREWRNGFGSPPIVLDAEPQPCATTFDFGVRVEWRSKDFDWEWRDRDRFSACVPVRVSGSIDDIMTPVVDPAIDALMGQITNGQSLNLSCNLWQTCEARTKNIAFGVLMEYRRDGVVQAIERVWWKGGTPPGVGRSVWGDREWVLEWPRERVYAADYGDRWTLRIRSDPETALRVIDADRYWQGDVTIQLTVPTR